MASNQTNRFGQDRGPTYDNDDSYYHRNYNISGVELEHDDWRHGFESINNDLPPRDINDRVRGIRGTMRDHYGKGPKNWHRTDEKILEDVCETLYQSYFIDASNIEVEVKEGQVRLFGSVNSRDEKREAERSIEFIPGVVDVLNEIHIFQSQMKADI
ncbi:MAG: BON domain-containing protein [Bacteriovoracaceae bacterium]